MKTVLKVVLITVLISVVFGISLSFIPWGESNGFHGKGVPFPVVLWDKLKGQDRLVDFVNPFGFLQNILSVLLLCVIFLTVWFAGKYVVKFIKKRVGCGPPL